MTRWLVYSLGVAAAALIAAGASTGGSAPSPETPAELHDGYVVSGGTVTLTFDTQTLENLSLRFVSHGEIEGSPLGDQVTFGVEESSTLSVERVDGAFYEISGGVALTQGALLIDKPGGRAVIGNLAIGVNSDGVYTVASRLDEQGVSEVVFELMTVLIDFSAGARQLSLIGELSIVDSWAWTLGMPDAGGAVIGSVALEANVVPTDGAAVASSWDPDDDSPGGEGGVAWSVGPDVIIGSLQSTKRYGHVGDITGFSVGTTACNLGDERADWTSYTNKHPVIQYSLHRLKDDRFEQVGLSWVKHGFYAISADFCDLWPGTNCGDPTDGSELGVGCSDPYSASLNGVQRNMSPRHLVNAHTGDFPYPWEGWNNQDPLPVVERRLQVHDADLDPDLNAGAKYFIQGHYVHHDDAAAGNQDNNLSHRQVVVDRHPDDEDHFRVLINFAWSTQREQPVIRAWQDHDPEVVETDIRVPGEGLLVLAAKATDLGDDSWRYTYALENLNSDRSGRSFSVPIAPGVNLTNIGFHDVDYHSGEPYDLADWEPTVATHSISWSTHSFDIMENANALRWGTVYTFWFDANVPPEPATVTVGFFKPGTVDEVSAESIGPSLTVEDCNQNGIPDDQDILNQTSTDCDGNGVPDECQVDCNDNGVADPCDIADGTSIDCNGNEVPDECEPDCNDNGVADECDILDGTSNDCQPNGIPDECEPDFDGDGIPDDCDYPEDKDQDGVDNQYDLCPYTTPPGACTCPDEVCCITELSDCIAVVPPWICIEFFGGTPACIEENLCRQGCLLGDFDRDGDVDLRDFAALQISFSGPVGGVGYFMPAEEYRFVFDRDEDDDIDLDDFDDLPPDRTGP